MTDKCKKSIYRWLLLPLGALLLGGCLAQQKKLEPYQEKSAQPVRSEEVQMASSKPLPEVDKGPQASEYKAQEKSAQNSTDPGDILPSLTLVDDRIIVYEEKLRQWDDFGKQALELNIDQEQLRKITECQLQIRNILAGYNELHENLLDASSGRGNLHSASGQLVAVERKDMSFLDGECQQIVRANQETEGWLSGNRNRIIEEKEKEIDGAAESSDYQKVIELYEGFSPEDQAELSIGTIQHYGQALLHTDNARQASLVFQSLLAKIRRESLVQKEFEIMKLVADISFGLEEYNSAFERYVDIINRYASLGENVEWARVQQSFITDREEKGTEVKSFAELMLANLTYNPANDGYAVALMARNFTENYPQSPLYATAAHIYLEARDKADAWFASIIEQIDRFRAEKKYEEGLVFIEELPRINMLPEKQEQLRQLTDEFISAQFEAAEKMKMAQEKELEEAWNTGQEYLRTKDYDSAIEVFSSLLETSYSERAKMQIEEASQLAVQENRRKAAELFVRANRATDLNTKIELLLESRQLLQNILAKYPQSYLLDKVKRNMSRIEEEISAIDPALLNSTASGQPEDIESSPGGLSTGNPAPVSVDTQQDASQKTGNE